MRILNPLIRILLRYEVTHKEFSELAKRSYIDVANDHYCIPNRKKTFSRVAVLTGLSRKEVVRLTNLENENQADRTRPLNRAASVINGWLNETKFLDENNEPRDLPLRGEEGSFEELVALFSGDITARAIFDELVRVGSIEKLDKETVRLTTHGFIPGNDESELLEIISRHVGEMLDTAQHNLTNEEKQFERQIYYTEVPDSTVREFQKYSNKKSQELLNDYSKWLRNKEKELDQDDLEKKYRIGVGIYFFRNDG